MNDKMYDKSRSHKRPIAEINIVPYVDVMLVLLIIFMVTAPMLTQGVQVDLPLAKAEPIPDSHKPPLVVSVDTKGLLYLDQDREPSDSNQIAVRVIAALKRDPTRTVLVKGDKHVEYGRVMSAMVLLKQSGVAKVGLMTQHYEEG